MEGMKEEYAEEPKVEAVLEVVVLGEEGKQVVVMTMDTKETKMRVERNVDRGNLLVEVVMEERRRKTRKTRSVQRTMVKTK
jgi:hypothetical protein